MTNQWISQNHNNHLINQNIIRECMIHGYEVIGNFLDVYESLFYAWGQDKPQLKTRMLWLGEGDWYAKVVSNFPKNMYA